MKMQTTLALVAALAFASTADAALRTFTIDFGGTAAQISPVATPLIFAYTDGAFASSNNVASGELQTDFTINHSSAPGLDFNLASIVHSIPNDRFAFNFSGSDAGASGLQIVFDGDDFSGVPSGADLPDGVEARAGVTYFGPLGIGPINDATITIGTAAIPEPSAFGFGALALAVTGLGRWLRKRFFIAAAE